MPGTDAMLSTIVPCEFAVEVMAPQECGFTTFSLKSDQTVRNILPRHGIVPAPKRSQTTSWKDFIAAHMYVLAGAGFFTVEVPSWRGLVTYHVLFFIHLESRCVTVAGITRHPDQGWMEQIARSATQETWVIVFHAAMFSMIATRSSAHRFGRCWRPPA